MEQTKQMNHKERFLRALLRYKTDRVSAACPLQTATVEMMEKTGAFWPEANKNAQKMAVLAEAAYMYAGVESIRVPFDLCVEAEVLGSKISDGQKNSHPSVVTPALKNETMLDVCFRPDPKTSGRMKTVCDSISILSEKYNDVPIIAGIVGPFTLAGQLRGIETLLMDFFDNPDFVTNLLEYTTSVLKDYAKVLEECGADSIVVIDPSAGCELIGKKYYSDIAQPYCRKLIDSINIPVILHICGDTTPILEMMAATNANAISLDHLVDIHEAVKRIGDSVCLIGNINSSDTLFLGTPEDVSNEVKKCISAGVFVVAPGCGIPPNTPIENIQSWVQTVKNFNQ